MVLVEEQGQHFSLRLWMVGLLRNGSYHGCVAIVDWHHKCSLFCTSASQKPHTGYLDVRVKCRFSSRVSISSFFFFFFFTKLCHGLITLGKNFSKLTGDNKLQIQDTQRHPRRTHIQKKTHRDITQSSVSK